MTLSLDKRKRTLVVRHPVSDQVLAAALIVLFLSIVVWYIQKTPRFHLSAVWVVLFFSAPVFLGIWILRTKITVQLDRIERREMRVRRIDLPSNVVVEKNGSSARLREQESGFDYRFPKYLGHRGRLEARLRELFEQE